MLLFGTSDLSADMGIPGQIGHPRIKAAYENVAAICRLRGKVLGMGGVYDSTYAPIYIGLGARMVLGASDHQLLMEAGTARTGFLRGLA